MNELRVVPVEVLDQAISEVRRMTSEATLPYMRPPGGVTPCVPAGDVVDVLLDLRLCGIGLDDALEAEDDPVKRLCVKGHWWVGRRRADWDLRRRS